MRIAFIGTGIMGTPMARRLAGARYDVRAWNRTAARARALAGAGVRPCADKKEAVREADLVILMPSTGEVCSQLLFDGEGAIANHLPIAARVVVMSSIPPGTARAQAERLEASGFGYVDAPVSGGEAGAVDGTLAIMAGGKDHDIEAVRPVLSRLGRVTHVGPVGSGQLVKLANQLIVGVTIGAVAEALALVEAGGGEGRAALEAIAGGFADSAVLRAHGRRMIERDFVPGGRADLQLKDMATIVAEAEALGLALPLAGCAHDLYHALCAAGHGGLDHSALSLAIAPAGAAADGKSDARKT